MENNDEYTEVKLTPYEFMDLMYDSWFRMVESLTNAVEDDKKREVETQVILGTLSHFFGKILTNNVNKEDHEHFIQDLSAWTTKAKNVLADNEKKDIDA